MGAGAYQFRNTCYIPAAFYMALTELKEKKEFIHAYSYALIPKSRRHPPELKYIEVGLYLDYFLLEYRSYPNSSAKTSRYLLF